MLILVFSGESRERLEMDTATVTATDLAFLSDEEVAELFAKGDADRGLLERQFDQNRIKLRRELLAEGVLNSEGIEHMMRRYRETFDEWFNRLIASLAAAALEFYSIEDIRTILQFRLEHQDLHRRSQEFAMQQGTTLLQHYQEFNSLIQQEYDSLNRFKRNRYR